MATPQRVRRILGLAILAASVDAPAASLSIFHNNDGESKLFGDAGFGGAAYFLATLSTATASSPRARPSPPCRSPTASPCWAVRIS